MADTPNPEATPSPEPEKGTPEYNEKMATLYANQNGNEDSSPVKPENVPDKFWDAETGQVNIDSLLGSYTELEKKLSSPKPDADEAPKGAPQIKSKEAGTENAEGEGGESEAFDWTSFETTIQEKGELDESSYEALEKIGIPKNIIDNYVSLAAASGEFAAMRSAQYVGGQEQLDNIMTQAGENLTDEEIGKYNELLAGPSWNVALDALKARFGDASAQPQTDTQGDLFSGMTGGDSGSTTVFQNRTEMANAINKYDDQGRKIYEIDPTYRRQVQARIVASRKAGKF